MGPMGTCEAKKNPLLAGHDGGISVVAGRLGSPFGAGSRNRTRDLLITNQLLYQLSYAGKMGGHFGCPTVILPQPGAIQRHRLRACRQLAELRGIGGFEQRHIQPPLRGRFTAGRKRLRGETGGTQRFLPAQRGLAAAVAAQRDAVGFLAIVDDQEIVEAGRADPLRDGLRGFAAFGRRQQHAIPAGASTWHCPWPGCLYH